MNSFLKRYCQSLDCSRFWSWIFLSFASVVLAACSGGTTVGNPALPDLSSPQKVQLSLISSSAETSAAYRGFDRSSFFDFAGRPRGLASIVGLLSHLQLKPVYANPGELKSIGFCFRRIRFKNELETTPESQDVEINPGWVKFTGAATSLGVVRVPPGSYGRIEMELRELCSGNGSVELENSFGVFSTREKFSLRFEGRFNLLNGADLKLNLFAWTSALSLVQNSAQLKPAFEAIQGKYSDR